jgi:hypothetical protein
LGKKQGAVLVLVSVRLAVAGFPARSAVSARKRLLPGTRETFVKMKLPAASAEVVQGPLAEVTLERVTLRLGSV